MKWGPKRDTRRANGRPRNPREASSPFVQEVSAGVPTGGAKSEGLPGVFDGYSVQGERMTTVTRW
jgi:hypothetical protein